MPLILLSPTKTLDFSGERSLQHQPPRTAPVFQEVASALASHMATFTRAQLAKLLGISDDLAATNTKRFAAFAAEPEPDAVEYAALAYHGPSFQGLDAPSLPKDAVNYLQDRLCVLSGMYGVVRPFDAIQPYRLCMGTKLAGKSIGGKTITSLYNLWAQHGIAAELKTRLVRKAPFVINLASQEYSKVVDRSAFPEDVLWIDCVFKNSGRVLSFFAKQARGLMARHCALINLQTPEQLKAFNLEGYTFQPAESTPTLYVFDRPKPPPAAASKANSKKKEPAKPNPAKKTAATAGRKAVARSTQAKRKPSSAPSEAGGHAARSSKRRRGKSGTES